MDRQVSAISRAENFNLYRLGKLRSHLTTEATKILVPSLIVISHLDYANSLLAGFPKEKLRQSVQDSAAARLINRGVFSTEESSFDCTGSLSTTGFSLRSYFLSSTVCKELHQSTYKSALLSTYPAMQVYERGRGVFVWWPQLELGGRGTLHQSQPTKGGRLLLMHRTTGTNFHQLSGQLLVAKISRNSLRHTFLPCHTPF
jgi:hypothetical protein